MGGGYPLFVVGWFGGSIVDDGGGIGEMGWWGSLLLS